MVGCHPQTPAVHRPPPLPRKSVLHVSQVIISSVAAAMNTGQNCSHIERSGERMNERWRRVATMFFGAALDPG